MGWLDSEEDFVGLSIIKLGGDEDDNILARGLISGRNAGLRPATSIRNAILTSLAVQGNAYFRFAERGDYIHELPTGSLNDYYVDRSAVQGVLSSLLPDFKPLLGDAFLGADPASIFWAQHELQNSDGYSLNTNLVTLEICEITGDPDGPQWEQCRDEECTLVDARYNDYGTSAYLYYIETYDPGDGFPERERKVYFYHQISTKPIATALYHYGSYWLDTSVPAADRLLRAYIYMQGTPPPNNIPALDVVNEYDTDSSYYPIVPLRQKYRFIDADTTSFEYTSSKAILKKVGIKLDSILSQLRGEGNEAGDGTKPDLEDIQEISFGYMAPMATTSEAIMEYMVRFFYLLSSESPYKKDQWEGLASYDPDSVVFPGRNTIAVDEQAFSFRLVYNYIDIQHYDGVLGKKGSFHTFIGERHSAQITRLSPYASLDNEGTGTLTRRYAATPVYYGWQYETNKYYVIEINGPTTSHRIDTPNDGILGTGASFDEDGQLDINMCIPVNNRTLEGMSALLQHKVLLDSSSLVVYGVTTVTTKWYQSRFFQFVVLVVVVVIAVYTGQFDKIAQVAAAMASGTAGGLAFAASTIALSAITGLAASYVLKFAIKQLGLEGTIFAVIALAAVAYYSPGSIPGLEFALNAQDLLKLVSVIVKIVTMDTELNAEALAEDIKDFQQTKAEQEAELEELEDLDSGRYLLNYDGLIAFSTSMFDDESVEQYYNRVLDQNPGIRVFAVQDNYVNYMLTLPENDMTLPWTRDTDTNIK